MKEAPANDTRYALGPRLGTGGGGEVFRAKDTWLGRDVALKLLSEKPSSAEARRFEREGRLTAGLTHPNIVSVFDVGVFEGRAFIAMELVDGRSLGELVEEGALTLRERLRVFVKVCDAITYAHEKGVVHRDLKPDNVMVGRFGDVLVLDWGLARAPDGTGPDRAAGEGTRLTRLGQIMGTPYYMAPEQAQGFGREAGTAADVYALGALLYTLCSGRPPFDTVHLLEVVTRVAAGEVVSLASVAPKTPTRLVEIVERAMAVRPPDRFEDVASLREAVIEAVLEASPRVESGPPAWIYGLGALSIVSVAVFLGLLIVVLIVLIAPG